MQASGNIDIRQTRAAAKSIGFNFIQVLRKRHGRQTGAAPKRVRPDRNNAVRKNHRRQRSIPIKRGIPDDRHSVRNRDRRSVARVLLQRQARRAAVAVKGVSQLKIFHPKVVLRLGQRFRRAAANGTAKPQRIGGDIVSNAFHSSRNFYFRQTVAAQKDIRAQRLQSLRKPERRKAGAAVKCPISNRLNAVRHDDLRQTGAASKRRIPDRRNPRRQMKLCQTGAASKRRIPDQRDPRRQMNLRDRALCVKRFLPDGRHPVRHGNDGVAAGVFRQHAVFVDGEIAAFRRAAKQREQKAGKQRSPKQLPFQDNAPPYDLRPIFYQNKWDNSTEIYAFFSLDSFALTC